MRVLHVLANGPPDVNGYAIRTKMILEHLDQFTDADVIGLTSPWYPKNGNMGKPHEEKGVTYLRAPHPAQTKDKLPLLLKIARWVETRHQHHYPQDYEKALEMRKKRGEADVPIRACPRAVSSPPGRPHPLPRYWAPVPG